nr:helicase-related protein [Clostridium sp. NSJ-145]
MRYYQEQAFDLLKDRSYATLIMPIFSGKNYVALNIIGYVKKKTLIFCNGKEQLERWKKQLVKLLGVSTERITICDSENFIINDFILCNYEYISTNRKIIEKLIYSEWGMVVYDDAHKAVTDNVIDILLIKSERKIALASSLDRSDGKEKKLFSVFGEAIYNITNNELINHLYQKELDIQRVSIEECKKSKEDIIREKLLELENRRVIIVAHKVDDVETIAKELKIDFLNQKISEEARDELVEKFNNKDINVFCCSNLIEKYRFMDVDVMIAAGYRGKSKTEEHFRIGTLISTRDQLDRMKKVYNIYLYDSKEEKIVNEKIGYLKEWGFLRT